jgi:hypothetical protein
MYQIKSGKVAHQNYAQKMAQGDPLLGAIGSIVGSAVGGSIGGPTGASIGSSIGGQIGGTGTIDLEKTALQTAQGTAGDALGSAMGNMIDQQKGALAAANDLSIDPLSEQAQMLGAQGGVDFAPNVFEENPNAGYLGMMTQRYFNQGGNVPKSAWVPDQSYYNGFSPQGGLTSTMKGGQGLLPDMVVDPALAMQHAIAQAPLAALLSPVGAITSGMITSHQMDALGQASDALDNKPEGMVSISDGLGNVRNVSQGQTDALQALSGQTGDKWKSDQFKTAAEAAVVANTGLNSPAHEIEKAKNAYSLAQGNKLSESITPTGSVVMGRDGSRVKDKYGRDIHTPARAPLGSLPTGKEFFSMGIFSPVIRAAAKQPEVNSSSNGSRGAAGTPNQYGGNYTSATERGLSIARNDSYADGSFGD